MTKESQTSNRKLTAIVAADIVGYSRLMGVNEEHTISMLQKYRAEVFQPLISEYQGRLANTAGDSYLIEFPSAVNAVRFAVDVQDRIKLRNRDVPDELRIIYRMGVNVGDVVSDGDDLLGDGVNVAARIEAEAPPGGICVSRSVRDQIRDRLDFDLVDLGEIQVKNIARPVRIFQVGHEGDRQSPPSSPSALPGKRYLLLAGMLFLLMAGGSSYWYFNKTDFEPVSAEQMQLSLPGKPSIAVMPFEYIGADDDDGVYLTDGLSENITSHLTDIQGLFVIGKQSTRAYSEKSAGVREVAAAFGVRYVLTGSLQKQGETLRVTSSLVDALSGRQIWSSRFDRPIADWFSIQDDITLAVIDQVYGQAIQGEGSSWAKTKNLQAFIHTVKGRYEQQAFSPKGNRRARKHFEAALQLDPEISHAYLGISFSHLMDARLGYTSRPSVSLALAEEYAWKGLEKNPDDLSAYRFLAMIRVVEKNAVDAREFIDRALESGDGDANTVAAAAWVFKYIGEPERAVELFARVKRLQPVHQWWLIADEYGALLDAGRYQQALEYAQEYIAFAPPGMESLFTAYTAIPVYHVQGEYAAREIVSVLLKENPKLSIKDFYSFDLAYVDRSFPENRYALLNQLGLPD